MGEQRPEMSRRIVLRGAAVSGLAAPLLVACGSDDEPAGSGSGETEASPSGADGGTSVATSDVPVGGGTVLSDAEVVVTQPSEGDFKAFSAVCTHQGCIVQTVSDGAINCPCHGSAFSVEDGSVVNGPATSPLESRSVSVEGDSVRVS